MFNALLITQLAEFKFRTRLQNCLHADEIMTMEDLISLTENQLLKVPNMGPVTVRELVAFLAVRGLRLTTRYPPR